MSWPESRSLAKAGRMMEPSRHLAETGISEGRDNGKKQKGSSNLSCRAREHGCSSVQVCPVALPLEWWSVVLQVLHAFSVGSG